MVIGFPSKFNIFNVICVLEGIWLFKNPGTEREKPLIVQEGEVLTKLGKSVLLIWHVGDPIIYISLGKTI